MWSSSRIPAIFHDKKIQFCVWAPCSQKVSVKKGVLILFIWAKCNCYFTSNFLLRYFCVVQCLLSGWGSWVIFWLRMPTSAKARSKNRLPYLRDERSHLLSERRRLWFAAGDGFPLWWQAEAPGSLLPPSVAMAKLQRPGSAREPQARLGEEQTWSSLQPWIVLLHTACRKAAGEGSCWAPPGILCGAALKERKNHCCVGFYHPASPPAALSNTAFMCKSKSVFPRFEQRVDSTFPGPGGFTLSSPFIEHQSERLKHIINFIYASVTQE